jgi:hypothetical protein
MSTGLSWIAKQVYSSKSVFTTAALADAGDEDLDVHGDLFEKNVGAMVWSTAFLVGTFVSRPPPDIIEEAQTRLSATSILS